MCLSFVPLLGFVRFSTIVSDRFCCAESSIKRLVGMLKEVGFGAVQYTWVTLEFEWSPPALLTSDIPAPSLHLLIRLF